MSSKWFFFDPLTQEDREEREQVIAEIAAAERVAIDACRQIAATAKDHPDIAQRAGSAALTHIATLAGVEGKTLWKTVNTQNGVKP